MGVRFEPSRGGVKVYTDAGVFLGTAHGSRLSSRKALAQLSLTEDPKTGELKSLTGAARIAVLEGDD